jgi:tetratricopeptide (TPR) repeat protein
MKRASKPEARRRWAASAPAIESGLAALRAGRTEAAEAIFRDVLRRTGDHPDALHLTGVIALRSGRPEEARVSIRNALLARPQWPEALVNLASVERLAGDHQTALRLYRQAIALRPNDPLAHSNLARLLNDLGQHAAALQSSETAVRLHPRFAAARVNQAIALTALGRRPDAVAAWRAALAMEPDSADSHFQLGMLLSQTEQTEAAHACFTQAVRLQPDNPLFRAALGGALSRLADGEGAVAEFSAALATAPEMQHAWIGLAWAQRSLGRFDEAEAALEKLSQLAPHRADAYRHLVSNSTGADQANAETLRRLAAAFEKTQTPPRERVSAGFALGRLLDEAGAHEAAFERYAAANQLVQDCWAREWSRYDAASFSGLVDRLIETYSPAFLDEAASGLMSDQLVFVVGMPRSGTTLVEQICASHSQVFGAGELHDIGRIAREVGGRRDAVLAPRQAAPADALALARAHLRRLAERSGGAARVIDKMPDNILQVGLIASLFPRARIILCRRDPRDVALSCFFQLFSEGLMHFSYDLATCGHRCREVDRLSDHWALTLPGRVMRLDYESLVADLEGQSRRLIDFVGLAWEPACLAFHLTQRTVNTASQWQVRQPLYSRSVGRWRRYKPFLSPLLAALDDRADEAGSVRLR